MIDTPEKSSNQPTHLYTIQELEQITGLDETYIRRRIKSGELRASFLDQYRVTPEDFQAWVESRRNMQPQKLGRPKGSKGRPKGQKQHKEENKEEVA